MTMVRAREVVEPKELVKRLICHLQRFYRKHGTNGYALKGDLTNFFGSTSHDLAYRSVKKRIDDTWASIESKRIIDSFDNGINPNIGMGLGSQCTQIIQLAVLDDFDHFIKEVLRIKHYVRYNDDFILVHEDKEYLSYCLSEINKWMSARELKLNPKKTQIIKLSQGVKFLGFRFRLTETGKVVMTLLPEKISHQRRKLKRMTDRVARGEMTKEDVDRSYESFKANITNNGKHKSEHPGKRARRSCHSLELAMDAFYKDLWRDDKCSDLKQIFNQLIEARRDNEALLAKIVKANSDIEYLAMMTDNELEQEETDDARTEI